MKTIFVKSNGINMVGSIYPMGQRKSLEEQIANEIGITKRLMGNDFVETHKCICAYGATCFSVFTEKEDLRWLVWDSSKRYILVGYFETMKVLKPIYESDDLDFIKQKRDEYLDDILKLDKTPDDMLWYGKDRDGVFIMRIIELPNNESTLVSPAIGNDLVKLINKATEWVKSFVTEYGKDGYYYLNDIKNFGIVREDVRDVYVIMGKALYVSKNGNVFIITDNAVLYEIDNMIIDELVMLPDMLISDLKERQNKNIK